MADAADAIAVAQLQQLLAQDPQKHAHLMSVRDKMTSLGSFPASAGGPADLFLLGHGSILLEPEAAAQTTFGEVETLIADQGLFFPEWTTRGHFAYLRTKHAHRRTFWPRWQ